MAQWGGRRAQAFTRLVLATYGDLCHLCGHAGADSADHLTPRSMGGAWFDLGNALPAHHEPCPTCRLRCNNRRNNRPAPRRELDVDGTAYVD